MTKTRLYDYAPRLLQAMDILSHTKKLCREYGIRPARSKGQNFLIRPTVYDRIVAYADLKPTDTVVEVGPGFGFLTERLARSAQQVIAVELDDAVAQALRSRLAHEGIGNVTVVNEDILKMDSNELNAVIASEVQTQRGNLVNAAMSVDGGIASSSSVSVPRRGNGLTPPRNDTAHYKVVANLPYNITSRVIRKFLSEMEVPPSLMVIMVQKEVAERLIAKPPQMSVLGVSAQLYADVSYERTVPAAAFWPAPQVESAVVSLRVRPGEATQDVEVIMRLVRFGFAHKRKTLANNLKEGLQCDRAAIEAALAHVPLDPQARAQELSLEQWRKLLVVLQKENMV